MYCHHAGNNPHPNADSHSRPVFVCNRMHFLICGVQPYNHGNKKERVLLAEKVDIIIKVNNNPNKNQGLIVF